MVGREYDYIRGNTAVDPKRKYRTVEEERKVHKNKVKKQPKVKTYKIGQTKGVTAIACLIFGLGFLTVGSYGKLYTMQNSLIKLNSNIKSISLENEAIKVDLLKFSSIHGIKKAATDKEMVLPAKADTIDVKWSKDYFSDLN